ncbi:MAG: hypothetical protein N2595_00715 [bacterium]|nr:hypothetical protein [bacterium]
MNRRARGWCFSVEKGLGGVRAGLVRALMRVPRLVPLHEGGSVNCAWEDYGKGCRYRDVVINVRRRSFIWLSWFVAAR